jgi:hypothetical protein
VLQEKKNLVTRHIKKIQKNERQTILFLEQGLVDDIVVIDISINHVIVQVEINRITHRNPGKVVARWARTPVFPQISEHIGVITQKVKNRVAERYMERPLATGVPFQWGRQLTRDLANCQLAFLCPVARVHSPYRTLW